MLKTTVALPSDPALAVARALGEVRGPGDILAVLAQQGEPLGLDYWALGMAQGPQPGLWLSSVAPLELDSLRAEVAEFLVAIGSQTLSADSAPDWSGAGQKVLCLAPGRHALCGPFPGRQDCWVRLADDVRAVVRASGRNLAPDAPAAVQEMVRAATPYLRAVTLGQERRSGLFDPDSGVYCEAFFLDSLDREIERARRHLGELSLAVLELQPGNVACELSAAVHRRLGAHLREQVRRTDLAGRLGPRSYGVFLYNTGPRLALIAAGRIAAALSVDSALAGQLTFALGVSGWEVTGPDALGVLSQAREAALEALLIAPGRAFVYA